MSDEETTVKVRAVGDGEWHDLSKQGVRDEWTERGLGGVDPSVRQERIAEELRGNSRRLTIEWLGRYLPSESCRAIELGCGWGRIFLGMKERYPQLDYRGIDLTDNLIELARQLAQDHRIQQPFSLDVGDAEALPFEDGQFDFAYSCRVFQYLPHPDQGAREAFRILKPGGRLVVVVPNRQNPKRKRYHTTLPGPDDVRAWFSEAGFTGLRTDYYGYMPIARYEMGLLDRAVEIASHVPIVRNIGALMLVTGVKPG